MKNSINLCFDRLSNHDFGGVHNRVAAAAASITLKDVRTLLESYNASIQKFTDYVGNVSVADSRHDASRSDYDRCLAFRNFRNQVSLLRQYPDESVASLGEELWKVVKNYGNVLSMPQGATTDVIASTLVSAKSLVGQERFVEAYAGCGLGVLLNKLDETQATFMSADQVRAEERFARAQETNKMLRDACVECFAKLVRCAQYNVDFKEDPTCIEFLGKVEGFVNSARSLYQSRASRNAKKREDAAMAVAPSVDINELAGDKRGVDAA